MTTTVAAAGKERYVAAFEGLAGELASEPEELGRLRHDAIEHFGDVGFPTTKMEEWRFTNVISSWPLKPR